MANDLATRIDQLVQQQMATGRFQSANEVVVEALETLRDLESFAEPFHEELRQRLDRTGQGNTMPLNRLAFFAEARRRVANAS